MGISQSMSLISIVFILNRDWFLLIYLFILFTFCCPLFMHLVIIAIVFFKLKVNPTIAKMYSCCHRFCMVDVFILGVLVSLIKLLGLAQVSFHSGFFSSMLFAILMVWCARRGSPYSVWNLVMTSDTVMRNAHIGMRGIDQGLIWCRHCGMIYKRKSTKLSKYWASHQELLRRNDDRYLFQGEQKCPRCGTDNDYRATKCYQKTFALLITAIILYLPSNIYPIMYTSYLGSSVGSNILDGVVSLWGMKSYFVAAVILIASICIPILKIVCIIWLLVIAHFGFKGYPSRYNLLYRVILFIGRWSMIDVFVVIVMSTVVRMSGLLAISPGIAIVFFCFTVLITMLAAEEFDERLLWDNALANRPRSIIDENGKIIRSAEFNDAAAADESAQTNEENGQKSPLSENLIKNYERLKSVIAANNKSASKEASNNADNKKDSSQVDDKAQAKQEKDSDELAQKRESDTAHKSNDLIKESKAKVD